MLDGREFGNDFMDWGFGLLALIIAINSWEHYGLDGGDLTYQNAQCPSNTWLCEYRLHGSRGKNDNRAVDSGVHCPGWFSGLRKATGTVVTSRYASTVST